MYAATGVVTTQTALKSSLKSCREHTSATAHEMHVAVVDLVGYVLP